MECRDRARLQKSYAECERAFAAARQDLQAKIGFSSKDEYNTLREAVNVAWEAVHVARAALDDHIREHGCGSTE